MKVHVVKMYGGLEAICTSWKKAQDIRLELIEEEECDPLAVEAEEVETDVRFDTNMEAK